MHATAEYERVAQSHFDALLQSGREPAEAIGQLEAAASFLDGEGQLELAQALREVMMRLRGSAPRVTTAVSASSPR